MISYFTEIVPISDTKIKITCGINTQDTIKYCLPLEPLKLFPEGKTYIVESFDKSVDTKVFDPNINECTVVRGKSN